MGEMYPNNQDINMFGENVSWPGVDSDTGKFTNGSFSDPLKKPSFIPAETINLILDNLAELIKLMGGTPNNSAAGQLAALFSSAAVVKKGIMRNAAGRAKIAAPAEADDIARKDTVDTVKDNLQQQITANNGRLPIGFRYLRWPDEPDPNAQFGGTWQNISTLYPGGFIRIEGGNASTFGSGKQAGQNKQHTHTQNAHTHTQDSHNHTIDHGHGHINSTGTFVAMNGVSNNDPNTYPDTGAFGNNGVLGSGVNGAQGNSSSFRRNFDLDRGGFEINNHTGNAGGKVATNQNTTATNQNEGGTEPRPDNWTLQLWKKTAH